MDSGLASSPASNMAGSPGTICNKKKEIKETPKSTGRSINILLIM
jgi:hypothetical protein